MANSFKVGVKTSGDQDWVYNALRFPDAEQAQTYADDLSGRWTAVEETTITESEDAVTVQYLNGKLVYPGEERDR